MYYSAIGLLALLVLVIENQDILKKSSGFELPAWQVYRKFLLTIMAYYVTDVLWGILESLKLRSLLFLDTSLYFIAMGVGVLFWTQYTVTYLEEENRFGRFLVGAGRFVAGLMALAVFANCFAPVLFSIDETCFYEARWARYILLVLQILLLLSISAYTLSGSKRNAKNGKGKKYRTLALFGLIMALFLFVQIFFPYLPLYAIAYLLGTCLLRARVIREEHENYRFTERMQEERIAYARINALTGDFICIYIVVPETGRYREYSATAGYEAYALPQEGLDFFGTAREKGVLAVCPDDRERYLSLFTKERVLSEIEHSGIFAMSYQLLFQGKPIHVRLSAAMVTEPEGQRLIVGLNNIDSHVRQEKDLEKRLMQAQNEANIDALTGVKNRHAYLRSEERLDRQIEARRVDPFALVLLDVNDLKHVNDTAGHQAGDQYLRDACAVICEIFRHSPVYRVGGDEFTVICQGRDYARLDELMNRMRIHNEEAMRGGGVVIACGMSRFDRDGSVALVFDRADANMYENKTHLKTEQSALRGTA